MHIVIFSHYVGFSDLNFGKNLAATVKQEYPEADIQLVTSPTIFLENKKTALEELAVFNRNNAFQALPFDQYLTSKKNPDIIMLGPSLNIVARRVDELVAIKDTPVLLFCEYDVSTCQLENFKKELTQAGFINVVVMPTGLGEGRVGILINRDVSEFEKGRLDQVESVFLELPITGSTILQGRTPKEYLDTTTTIVSSSHNNAVRLLRVHKGITDNIKNVDVIILGEMGNKDAIISTLIQHSPLDKGFSQIVYQTPQTESEIILKKANESEGHTYRVIHVVDVSHEEVINLRKIGGNFSGASGDESYNEAISTSSIIIYECPSWKKELVAGMQAMANKIDSSGMLARGIYLLATANTDNEYEELITLINSAGMKKQFLEYRNAVLDNKDLAVQFRIILSNLTRIVQLNQEKTANLKITTPSILRGLKNTLFGTSEEKPPHDPLLSNESEMQETTGPMDSKKP